MSFEKWKVKGHLQMVSLEPEEAHQPLKSADTVSMGFFLR